MSLVFARLAFGAAAALAGEDPISACRQAHGDDPPAHIECLERALSSQGAGPPAQEPSKADNSVELGAEQVTKARRATEAVDVQIVSLAYNSEGRGVFDMADGQQWRETERAPVRERLKVDRQYTARIQRGTVGGYRMYVDGVRRMIKVERVR